MKAYIEKGVSALLICVLLLLAVAELLELSIDINYLAKIILWSAFGYLMYRISPTRIFFGTKHSWADALLILSYFFLLIKDMVAYIYFDREKNPLFPEFYDLVLQHAVNLEIAGLYVGLVFLACTSLLLTFTLCMRKPSIGSLFLKNPNTKTVFNRVKRFVLIFIIYLSFFVLVFNLVVQWLGVSVFMFVLSSVVVLYFEFVHHHHRTFHTKHAFYKLGSGAEEFYQKATALLHTKHTFPLAVMGILVLHFVTDIASFLIPYVLNLTGFLQTFGPNHDSLYTLLGRSLEQAEGWNSIAIILIYVLNVAALGLILTAPPLLWYVWFKHQKIKIHKGYTVLLLSFSVLYLLFPVLKLSAFDGSAFVGVDITSHVLESQFTLFALLLLPLCIIIFSRVQKAHHRLFQQLVFSLVYLFMLYYVALYVKSVFEYYTQTLVLLIDRGHIVLMVQFFFFFILTVLFYLCSILLFAYDVYKKKIYKEIE